MMRLPFRARIGVDAEPALTATPSAYAANITALRLVRRYILTTYTVNDHQTLAKDCLISP
jgi:hypothetical protein